MQVNREKLLQQLEAVSPGLSPRDIIEQSSCLVFKKSEVFTFNDVIACRHDCMLKIEGAVPALPLLSILRKLPEEILEIDVQEGELVIQGKKRKAGIKMEAEISLPYDKVEVPDEWRPLHPEFGDAVGIVRQCCGTDESKFVATCVHIHPKWVEAFDNYQMSRYKLKTGLKGECLVPGESIKHISNLGVSEFAETATWIHFRNALGLMISCRRETEEFPDISSFLKMKGEPAVLPKGLGPAVDKAQDFSAESADKEVQVHLKPGKLKVVGRGNLGWYSEVKQFKYDGPEMKFTINPKLLMDITSKHSSCEISPSQLKVDTGKFIYVTSLDDDKPASDSVEE